MDMISLNMNATQGVRICTGSRFALGCIFENDWDEVESVQQSLGFSPFELVFGHTPRGPIKLMRKRSFLQITVL